MFHQVSIAFSSLFQCKKTHLTEDIPSLSMILGDDALPLLVGIIPHLSSRTPETVMEGSRRTSPREPDLIPSIEFEEIRFLGSRPFSAS